ncbi:MAG: AMP-binding protein, partial [Thermoanaerobaculia bacterium]
MTDDLNLADWFLGARLREGHGDRIALRLPEREVTYAEVAALAARFGNGLRAAGVRPEDRVMIALPDGAEWVGAFFGILEIGAIVIMVNPGLKPANLAALFDYTRARWVVIDEGARPLFGEATAAARWPPQGLDIARGSAFAAAVAAAPDTLDPEPTHHDDAAIWLFSGGTTGLPKAVVQTHASFVNTTELYAKAFLGYREGDVTL